MLFFKVEVLSGVTVGSPTGYPSSLQAAAIRFISAWPFATSPMQSKQVSAKPIIWLVQEHSVVVQLLNVYVKSSQL